MRTLNNQDWLFNIQNIADEALQHTTLQEVRDVFIQYGATDLDNLDPSNYEAVFSELQLLAYDY